MERDKALTQEEQNERTKFNAFQCIYVVCGLLYGGFWLKRDSFFGFLFNISGYAASDAFDFGI